jgi:hypothetical protein
LTIGFSDHSSGSGGDLLLVPGDALVHVQVEMLLNDVPHNRMLSIYIEKYIKYKTSHSEDLRLPCWNAEFLLIMIQVTSKNQAIMVEVIPKNKVYF